MVASKSYHDVWFEGEDRFEAFKKTMNHGDWKLEPVEGRCRDIDEWDVLFLQKQTLFQSIARKQNFTLSFFQ